MRLPVGAHRVPLGAPLAPPPLLPVLPAVVLLYPRQVPERAGGLVVHAPRLRAHVHLLRRPRPRGLRGRRPLPWQVVAPPVYLQVLVAPELLAAHLARERGRRQQRPRRQRHHFGVGIFERGIDSSQMLILKNSFRFYFQQVVSEVWLKIRKISNVDEVYGK
ncbi:protein indeterminate-domain 1 [Iris pallida]|uniref:Protein indeterminate-domain 1 n=1 Tax=Iris pallida TaxID=29817 RepID=A0AAX6G1U5_IRIPA|nr:protein indeterminate-domain 1 [Iris pallida]